MKTKPVALVIGRFQPFHNGHKALIQEAIKRTGFVLIGVKDVGELNERNPYTFEQIKEKIIDSLGVFANTRYYEIVHFPNITDVFYGRDVGYNIEQIHLPEEIEAIRATNIRRREQNETNVQR